MNILVMTTHFNTGGITSYVLTLAKGMRQKNQKVFIASSGGNRVEALSPLGVEHVQLNIRTKSELNPKIYFALRPLCRLMKEQKIDIIHSHTRITQVMGTILSKITGKPHVTTCHGFFKPKLARKLFPCWGNAVIAISEAVEEHLKNDFKVHERNVFLIHNGIDLNEFPAIDEATRRQRRKEFQLSDEPVVGIIARLSEVKGHGILIRAMQTVVTNIPRALLLIVGEGKLESVLRKQVRRLNLEGNVRFYPIANKTKDVMPLFDVFAMPSLQEGLGLSVMEAQAMGLAVVASRVGGIVSLIEDGQTGILVEPGDSRRLAEALIALLNDKGRARQIGEKARLFIGEKFSFEGMIRRTFNLYQQVARDA